MKVEFKDVVSGQTYDLFGDVTDANFTQTEPCVVLTREEHQALL